MKVRTLLALVGLGISLSPEAFGQFSVSGGGSFVPSSAVSDGTWNTALPEVPGSSVVSVPEPVFAIDSIVIRGFTHEWMGDLMCTLVDPNGKEYLVFVRPGYEYSGSFYGNSGDLLFGDYEFIESGAANELPTDDYEVDIHPGQYNQSFDTGGVFWTTGASNVHNTKLSEISGPAGNWELCLYDWYALADDGSFTGWTLNGNGAGSGGGFCYGDGTGSICPCGNLASAGQGCQNSTGSGGVLAAVGNPNITGDTLALKAFHCPSQRIGLFFQGERQLGGGSGWLFGDGLRCVGAPVIRLQTVQIDGTGTAISTVPLATVGGISPGDTVYYQFWYQDPGNSPCAMQFNTTNAVARTWN